jgi:hypothetical protein
MDWNADNDKTAEQLLSLRYCKWADTRVCPYDEWVSHRVIAMTGPVGLLCAKPFRSLPGKGLAET